MQREIKFKFWLGHTKKMTYAHTLQEVGKIIPEFSDDIVALQFTGLKDKNGKEIYEGDIVRYSRWNTKDGFSPMGLDGWKTGKVYFKEGRFVVEGNEGWDTLKYSNLEVIGSVFETPSLLNLTNK